MIDPLRQLEVQFRAIVQDRPELTVQALHGMLRIVDVSGNASEPPKILATVVEEFSTGFRYRFSIPGCSLGPLMASECISNAERLVKAHA